MDTISENKPNKHISIGVLAHVDAGKTTLSESMLYMSGSIRRLGRVDHKDAFLDTHELERDRGITIFSKQAVFTLGDKEVTLLDTPGHVDFSAEMERTLKVLDYAVLIISGADGVQGHTVTLWKLLHFYHVPVFIFVNKMDQEGTDREKLLEEIRRRLDSSCVDFGEEADTEVFGEQLAMCDEAVMEEYLETGIIQEHEIVRLIRERKVFPCYFGSALKLTGVKEFMESLMRYTQVPEYPGVFGAKVFKITRDGQGNRLTHMKITGGTLKVRDVIGEKVNQIRIYSGDKFEAVNEACAGMICAVTGLSNTSPGQGLGKEKASDAPVLEPVLSYQICLPEDADGHTSLRKLRMLEEEEPELHIVWDEHLEEIHAQVMGEVQIEILRSLIAQRYEMEVEFDAGSIVYKETIASTVEGVGHYEPLRHYAEVHLLLEPGKPGSGLSFDTKLSEDVLDGNWQRLILTHLQEKEHIGVLTGSPVTDIKITVIAGRAHLKHTEGGDFRQATYRAVRHGLKKAESVLLEPYYTFRLELPQESVGRAMADVQKMGGTFEPPVTEEEFTILSGAAPVAAMRDYQREVISYTKGRGRLFCQVKGYEPCHNTEEVIAAIGYDSERDLENPTGSVFCDHGAGFAVSWDKVEDYMHLEAAWKPEEEAWNAQAEARMAAAAVQKKPKEYGQVEKELEEIFARTYGPVKSRTVPETKRVTKASPRPTEYHPQKKKTSEEEYLLVDGYNIIFAWKELKELASVNIMSARDRLMDILSDYQGYRRMTLILVFDAYKVEGNPGSIFKYHNIHVVYTKEAETADQYIEKTVHAIGKNHHVTVATSDALEQVIILGQGGHRISSDGLLQEVETAKSELRNEYISKAKGGRTYLFDNLPDEMADTVERLRSGEDKR